MAALLLAVAALLACAAAERITLQEVLQDGGGGQFAGPGDEAYPGDGGAPTPSRRHLAELAAVGKDLQAFAQAVEANAAAMRAASLAEAAVPAPKWPWAKELSQSAIVAGEGAFGKVYVATVVCDKSKVAVKELGASDAKANNEAQMLKFFSTGPNASAHFVAYFRHEKKAAKWYIMMEAALGKTLEEIVRLKKPASASEKRQLFLDLAEGIQQMHKYNIVHRDLKPKNVMVSRTCHGSLPCHAKVGDLGLSCLLGGQSIQGLKLSACPKEIAGTPFYIAPETYSRQEVHLKNDVWALGMILYELEFGSLPKDLTACVDVTCLKRAVTKFDIGADARFHRHSEQGVKDLLARLLQTDMSERIGIDEAVQRASLLVNNSEPDMVAELPACFDGKTGTAHVPEPVQSRTDTVQSKAHTVQSKEDIAELERLSNIDMFRINKPQTNAASGYLFSSLLINHDGCVVDTSNQLNYLKARNYFKNPLAKGFKVLEVNGYSYSDVVNTPLLMKKLKDGIEGNLTVSYTATPPCV